MNFMKSTPDAHPTAFEVVVKDSRTRIDQRLEHWAGAAACSMYATPHRRHDSDSPNECPAQGGSGRLPNVGSSGLRSAISALSLRCRRYSRM
jgi:hypothetical protein